MTDTIEITADFNYLYRDGHKYFPVIQEEHLDLQTLEAANAVLIKLPASVDNELIWEKERAYAERASEEGKLILWEFDFGISTKKIDSSDSSLFYSLGIAVDEFVNTLWRDHKDVSIGVVLYRGDAHFARKFLWNDEQKQFFIEKMHVAPDKEKILDVIAKSGDDWAEAINHNSSFILYAADLFSEYFQRLASYLPDTAMPFCLFDVTEQENPAFLARLLSKERFQYILLGLKRSVVPAGHLNWDEGSCLGGWIGRSSPYFSTVSEVSLAVCLPSEEFFSQKATESLTKLFEELKALQIPYRIIPESLLTEGWNGIDNIIVISDSVSMQGKRRLQGFCAAGGKVVCIGERLNLANSIVYEEFGLELSNQEVFI